MCRLDLSSVYAQNFFLGLVLFYLSERLSRSRLFHYLLGATMGICFSALLALYFLQRQTHSATKMIPGVQLLQSLGSMLSVVVPFTGFVVVPSLYWVVARGVQYLIFIWNRETLFGVPHLGKIYFVAFGLLGCGIMWWNQWGAPAKSDEPAQKQEEIDEIGYLEEDLAPTTFQVVLSRSLKLLGFTLLFYSTSSTEMSLLLVLLVSLSRVFEFIAFVLYFWYHFEVRMPSLIDCSSVGTDLLALGWSRSPDGTRCSSRRRSSRRRASRRRRRRSSSCRSSCRRTRTSSTRSVRTTRCGCAGSSRAATTWTWPRASRPPRRRRRPRAAGPVRSSELGDCKRRRRILARA